MIGNDIVDLKLASIQSNWKRKGYLDKVFTKKEQELIISSTYSDKMVWLLWSIKESAYKIHIQQYSNRFFKPKKLSCKLTSFCEGIVEIEDDKYITRSEINNDYIHTIAILKKNIIIIDCCFKTTNTLYTNQHNECYKRIKIAVSKKFGIPIQEIQIKKNIAGVPKLYQNNKQLIVPISISHHGNYGAFSILN